MRIAVLGCGSIGRRLTGCLQGLGYHDLLHYDPDPASRQALWKERGVSCCPSLDEMWHSKPDVALIGSPSPTHLALGRDAIMHGCDVFIEKPLSDRMEGVDEFIQLATQHGVVSMVGCNMRFHPGPATIKRLLAEHIIGDVLATGSYLPDWRPGLDYRQGMSARSDMGGGALLECIHELDLALWLFGPAKLVGASVRRADSLGLEVEGAAVILLEHASGVHASVHLNYLQRDYNRECEIIGETGTIHWRFCHPWLEVRDNSSIRRIELDPFWELNSMYRDELAYFLRGVERREAVSQSLGEAAECLRIALKAKQYGAERLNGLSRRRKVMKTLAIIQARVSSTRLPEKVLAHIEGRPMLQRVIERVQTVPTIDQVVVATSVLAEDDRIEALCKAKGIACVRGSLTDVLDRYYSAATLFEADVIVRVTSDCPLTDPSIIGQAIARYSEGQFDYVSNGVKRTYPDGLDVEVFSFEALERAWKDARWTSEREHVTTYIWKHPEIFRIGHLTNDRDLSDLRWTVDNPQDLELIRRIYARLGDGPFGLSDILSVVENEPALTLLNSGIRCNEGYFKSIREDVFLTEDRPS
jgi:spore coat polysaccharide biosynthesis protein SpsF